MRRLLFSAPTLAATLALGACATGADQYPSLQIRDVERAQGQFTPTPAQKLDAPPIPVPLTGTLAEQLTQLSQQAEAAHQAFVKQVPGATRLTAAARGSAVGSDAWASAQVALASLDSARSDTAVSLADLDTIEISRLTAADDAGAIDPVRSQVAALIAEEDDTLARLRAGLD